MKVYVQVGGYECEYVRVFGTVEGAKASIEAEARVTYDSTPSWAFKTFEEFLHHEFEQIFEEVDVE